MAFRVLVVDDSPVMRAFVRRVLDVSGLDVGAVFEACDGVEALELLDREWVDVILTDINMPNMDGEEFVTRLIARESCQSVPVIVISTDGTQERMQHLRTLGVRGYLAKPFLPETLRREVEQVVGAGDAV
ncbi:MAG TPA: response regulator [Bryobacteraceae bacterium]|jgi:two-component system chemotaxis response regulator CheY